MRNARLLPAILLVLSASTSARAQEFQGGIRGSLRDADGVVPGVFVSLTNEETNSARSTETNERGEYAFTALEPGSYRLTASLTGYKTIDQAAIRVGTQSFLVLDLVLEVGTIADHLTVTGRTPIVESANASVGAVLDNSSLETLPTANRAAFLLGATVPTFIFSSDIHFTRQQDQSAASRISIGGGPSRGNDYTFDGVSITDVLNRVVANPSIEAIDDVKVQVHTYDAEIGRTGGGVFNITLRSGTNQWHGNAFFQTRPVWASANNYFSQKALESCGSDTSCVGRNRKPDTPYYSPGAGIGGPLKKNRTFFWATTEDYHDVLTMNISTTLPTAAERRGDFSALRNPSGARVTIYDPITHLPFPGNIIPADRINPVAAAITRYLPLPQIDVDNGTANYNVATQQEDRFQQQYTVKVEHKFTDAVSLSGFYLYNRTNEPCADYFEPGLHGANRFADPNDYLLQRRPQIAALNNAWVLDDRSVLTLRFGWTRFVDNSTMTIGFDPASLQTDGKGFSQTFLDEVAQTGVPKFPNGAILGYTVFGNTFGAITPSVRIYKSWSASGTYSRLLGGHTVKAGAAYRTTGVDSVSTGNSTGFFNFDKEFTSSNGTDNSSTTAGNAFATFLLGYPSGDSSNQSTMTLTTPLDVYANYYAVYAQDDWRVGSKLTVNLGLRVEHEDGIRERHNNITVGFDPAATNALSSITIPASIDPTGGTLARSVVGGLMYAGIDGNNDYQGNPPAIKLAPRGGLAFLLDARTVMRGGYGVFWAPWPYPTPNSATNNYGQVGYTSNTPSPQTSGTPTVMLDDPFPNRLVVPLPSRQRSLTGAGTSISFIDQYRTQPRVQQYSADLQREIGGDMSLRAAYIGARADHLPLGGTADTGVNINQLDPKYLVLGPSLNDVVANPFFGNSAFANTMLGASPTIHRSQLLRPYPQFMNVLDREISESVSRYNALVVEWTRRGSRLSGRVSYTYSVLKDNQIGEFNGISSGSSAPVNNYNYIAAMPPCTTTNYAACFDPLVDYTNGILDVPHRLVIAPIWQIPSPASSRGARLLASGWTAAAVVTLQSGFPIGVSQSGGQLLGNGQRPNIVPGVPVATSGNLADRLASADHPAAAWVNPAAFSVAPAGTWGNAPRLLTDVRTPAVINADISVAKQVPVASRGIAQVKIEVLNLFNRVQTFGLASVSAGNAAFGEITTQSGFMRTTQIMFRYSW